MADNDIHEWRLIDSDLTTVLRILPAASGHMYYEINNPGSGEIKIPLDTDSAGDIASGMFIENFYRGASRGGFFVENIKKTEVDGGENGGRYLSVSGRGALALLTDAIVWDDGTNETTRTFIAQSKAAILKTLIDEAMDRDVFLNMSYDFTASVDSDGNAWTDSEDYKINVGDNLLDVARNFSSTGGFDFDINLVAGEFVLSAYKNGIGTDKSNTVKFRAGADVQELSSDERGDEIKNVLRVKYKDGFSTVSDGTSVTNRRRREQLINAELAQSVASANTYASAKLDESKDPKTSISIKVYDGLAPNIFLDYILGDTVTYDVKGVETSYRILGLQVDFQNDDYATVILELNNIFYENDLKRAGQLDWLLSQWNTAKDNNLVEATFWAAWGNGATPASGAYVNDMVYYNGDIYVVGLGAIGAADCLGVAKYNIATGKWSSLGAGFTEECTAVAELDGNIYVGVVNSTTQVQLWRWDGSAWDNAEGGFSYGGAGFGDYPVMRINQMVANGGNLYICGDSFIGNDGSDFCYVYYIDGIGGGGFAGKAHDANLRSSKSVAFFGGDMYAGFDGITLTDEGFQVESGGNFTPVNITNMDGKSVERLIVYGSTLAIACEEVIAVWDGVATTWTVIVTLAGGGAFARTMAVYLSDLYVGGDFLTANGVTCNYIFRYNGAGVNSLGNVSGVGTNSAVRAMLYNDQDLYVGGAISLVGGVVTTNNLGVYFVNFEHAVKHIGNDSSVDVGAIIHAASADSITDSDEMGFYETVAGVLRKITWANIKATLKTYFDTLYVALTGNQTIAGIKTFSSFPVTPSSAPTTDYEVANKKYVDDSAGGGGGGLTYNATTVTTGNVTAVVENFYDCTIAGMTADRDFNLPTPAAAGKRIALRILDGDDTYELIIKANSVEITRVFIANEYMSFVSTGTGAGDWKIEVDKRVPCKVLMSREAAQSINTGSFTRVDVDTADPSVGMTVDLVTNHSAVVRRAGVYELPAMTSIAGLDDQEFLDCQVYINGSAISSASNWISYSGSNVAQRTNAPVRSVPLAIGDEIQLYIRHNEGTAQNTLTAASFGSPFVWIKEIL